MADEPKKTRKRVSKKVASSTPASTTGNDDTSPPAKEKKISKSAGSKAIPVPLFQAAPAGVKKSAAAKSVSKSATKVSREEPLSDSDASSTADGESISDNASDTRNRRRRRGGRGRRRPDREHSSSDSSLTRDDVETDENEDGAGESTELADGESQIRKRRRRRRSAADGVTSGEVVDEDGVVTIVKVREARTPASRPAPRSRPDKKDNDRSARSPRFKARDRERERPNRTEYRENRRRGTILTDAEFLARRESVDRQMLVRQLGDRTQIVVIEDKVLVEHYVNRNSNISYVGNVYLGKVQNVLPSMEAAFVDIGKGRNAVLYAGEVNWDAAGLTDNQPRKIEHVLKTGQSVLVQVTKDPIGQKGARLTSQISLPGRYLVFVPGGGMSGISRRLPESERSRLKSILKNLISDEEGVIVRTASEGASEDELTRDVTRLKAQWEDIKVKSETTGVSAPSLLYGEPDLTVRVIRDIFNEDFNKLTVQGEQAWNDINDYLGYIAPELVVKIDKWSGTGDLFNENRVDEQLSKALDRKVYLPSGGSLVIDKTEAMIVIDVNTGKFIGKGGNLEETVTKNNMEAAEEIARQLRLRDLGGIVVIDFIDMILESNREQVLRRLVECLGRDRTKHQVAEVTSLGLVQMTRKRVGQGLIEAFSTTCESCAGRGIHIHMEPVNKKSLDREMTPTFDSGDGANDDADLSLESFEPVSEPVNMEEKRRFGRRRRRATSSGTVAGSV